MKSCTLKLMSALSPLAKNELPPAPPLLKLIGPSFIILGVGLGSGELILWPYLSSNFGLGIIWVGIPYSGLIGILFLLLIGVLYSLGRVVYKTQERVQKAIILVGIPFVLIITLFLAKGSDWAALTQGVIGKGENFWFLPAGLPFATFLAALAYAGA